MLTNFQNLQMAEPYEEEREEGDKWGLQQLSVSISPKNVAIDDYDFILSLRDPKFDGFFGIRGTDLQVTGSATKLDGT